MTQRVADARDSRSVVAVLRPFGVLGVLACAVLLTGCYQRVVSSKGVGARQEQGGYRSDTFLDRAYDDLTGDDEKPPPPKTKVGTFRAR